VPIRPRLAVFIDWQNTYKTAREAFVPGVRFPSLRRPSLPCTSGNQGGSLPRLAEQRRIVAEVERQRAILDATRAAIDRALERSKALRRGDP